MRICQPQVKTVSLNFILLFLVSLALCRPPAGWADSQVPFEARPALAFTQNLFQARDYFRAISEAKRFLFFYPEHPEAQQARELMEKSRAALKKRMKNHEKKRPGPGSLRVFQNKTSQAAGGGLAVSLIRFYQNHLRTFKTSGCPSYPNCSEYAIQAINKHGAFWGTFIYVDRLFREVTTAGTPPFVRYRGRNLHYDPLEANDYWFGRQPGDRP